MRLFQFLFYTLALTIGGCLAFRHNIQFPHRSPKNLQYVEKQAETTRIDAGGIAAFTSANQALHDQGKALFKTKCASCHNRNMRDDLVGPALGGAEDRWADYPQEDLYNWIRNSPAMVNQGHPKAVEVWEAWDKLAMTPFPSLTDEEIEAILFYVEEIAN